MVRLMKISPYFAAFLTLLIMLAISIYVIVTVRNNAIEAEAERLLSSSVRYEYPRIPDCDEGVELWDCIRRKE